MKIKYSLIPFIPLTLVMIVFKLMSVVGLDSNGLFMGMNKVSVNYTVIGITIGLFVLCVLINLFDRKTSPVYPVKKNPISGVVAAGFGLLIIGQAILDFINLAPSSEYFMMSLICAILSIPAGIALILMSKVHFVGKSTVSGISMLFVFPSLWGCAFLVLEFLSATKVSISSFDLTPLFCYIFLTLFLFSYAMIASRIKGRNPVKACYIYGLPAAALCLAYGVEIIAVNFVEGMHFSKIIDGLAFIAASALIVSFVAELFMNPITKDELEIIDGIPTEEDKLQKKYVDTGDYEDLVFSEKPDDVSENTPIDEEGLKKRMESGEYDNLVFSDNPDDSPIDPIADEMRRLRHSTIKDNDSHEIVFSEDYDENRPSGQRRRTEVIENDDMHEIVFSEDYDERDKKASSGRKRKVETLSDDEMHELVFADDYDPNRGFGSSEKKKKKSTDPDVDFSELVFTPEPGFGSERKTRMNTPGDDEFILGNVPGDYEKDKKSVFGGKSKRGGKKKNPRNPEDMLKEAELSEKKKRSSESANRAEVELAELFTRNEKDSEKSKNSGDVDMLLAELDNINKQ